MGKVDAKRDLMVASVNMSGWPPGNCKLKKTVMNLLKNAKSRTLLLLLHLHAPFAGGFVATTIYMVDDGFLDSIREYEDDTQPAIPHSCITVLFRQHEFASMSTSLALRLYDMKLRCICLTLLAALDGLS